MRIANIRSRILAPSGAPTRLPAGDSGVHLALQRERYRPNGRDWHDARQGHRMGSVLRETAHDHKQRNHDDAAPDAKQPGKQARGGVDAHQDEHLFA
jgi:hypothetical protein